MEHCLEDVSSAGVTLLTGELQYIPASCNEQNHQDDNRDDESIGFVQVPFVGRRLVVGCVGWSRRGVAHCVVAAGNRH